MGRVMSGFLTATIRRDDADRVVRRHRLRIYRLALAMTGSADTAEDVTQDVCCRLSNSTEKLEHVKNEWAWIRRVTVRCAIDTFVEKPTTPIDDSMQAPLKNPDSKLEVGATLQKLSPEHRAILALSFFEQLSYQEIADALDIPIGSVSSRLHHAKNRFREEWEKED